MSYTYINEISSGPPNMWFFTSTDNLATIISENYIGSDWKSSFIEGDIILMQYMSDRTVVLVVHFDVSNNIFLLQQNAAFLNGNAAINRPIIWSNTATTTSGIATFYPTSDGTSSGTAFFTNIYSVQAMAIDNTTSAIAYPFSSLKQIVSGNKTITVNVGTGTTVGALGGASIVNAPDGTTVYLTIIGN